MLVEEMMQKSSVGWALRLTGSLARFEIEVTVEVTVDAAVKLWGGTSREGSLKNMKTFDHIL